MSFDSEEETGNYNQFLPDIDEEAEKYSLNLSRRIQLQSNLQRDSERVLISENSFGPPANSHKSIYTILYEKKVSTLARYIRLESFLILLLSILTLILGIGKLFSTFNISQYILCGLSTFIYKILRSEEIPNNSISTIDPNTCMMYFGDAWWIQTLSTLSTFTQAASLFYQFLISYRTSKLKYYFMAERLISKTKVNRIPFTAGIITDIVLGYSRTMDLHSKLYALNNLEMETIRELVRGTGVAYVIIIIINVLYCMGMGAILLFTYAKFMLATKSIYIYIYIML